ncbi:hypothetical protein BLOT_009798 [Blomia tropicalis]|nr:hypothetical protein BLOT_009798 [Blomia tropicalis]
MIRNRNYKIKLAQTMAKLARRNEANEDDFEFHPKKTYHRAGLFSFHPQKTYRRAGFFKQKSVTNSVFDQPWKF